MLRYMLGGGHGQPKKRGSYAWELMRMGFAGDSLLDLKPTDKKTGPRLFPREAK